MEKLSAIIDKSPKLKQPGFCVKTHNDHDSNKLFINFCFSNSISPPTIQLDEKDLQTLIEKEAFEELSQFTIPLVLEQLESTKDKKGNSAQLTHAIINDKFFKETILPSEIYKRFLIYITIETINLKFGLKLSLTSYVIMKNKLYQLPENVEVFNKFINSYVPPTTMLDTTNNNALPLLDQHKLVEINNDTLTRIGDDEENELEDTEDKHSNVIINLNTKLDVVDIFVKFTKIVNFEDIKLLLNDDRIVVQNGNKVVTDFNLSVNLKSDKANATFKNNTLTIKCPVSL